MFPFDSCKNGGRELIGIPSDGDGTCRHGYGLTIFEQCGTSCVYCGRDLGSSYEAWLDISIDHVIPVSPVRTSWYEERSEWIRDSINLVTCCRTCNEFLNNYNVKDSVPKSLPEFCKLRDKIFIEKKKQVLRRHKKEHTWYEKNKDKWDKTSVGPKMNWREGFATYKLTERFWKGKPIIKGLKIEGTIVNSVSDGSLQFSMRQLSWKRKIAQVVKERRLCKYNSNDHYTISIDFAFQMRNHGGVKKNLDIDNYLKPILDGIAAGLFCEDDCDLLTLPRFNFNDSNFDNIFLQRLENPNEKKDEAVFITVYKGQKYFSFVKEVI